MQTPRNDDDRWLVFVTVQITVKASGRVTAFVYSMLPIRCSIRQSLGGLQTLSVRAGRSFAMVCKPIHSPQVCVSSTAVISGESHVVVSSLISLVRIDLVQDAGSMQLPVQKYVRRHRFLDLLRTYKH